MASANGFGSRFDGDYFLYGRESRCENAMESASDLCSFVLCFDCGFCSGSGSCHGYEGG
jgi:hypothetical protein